MMSWLIRIESTSKLIETKMDKLMDFLYPGFFVDSEESKKLVILYLNNVIGSERNLMHTYEDFINEYIETTDDNLNK